MMDTGAVATVISSGISLALLWFILRFLYRDTLIDAYRGQLFQARDELFDAAHGGMFDFDNYAYRSLRKTINGHIVGASRLGLAWPLVFLSKGAREDLDTLGIQRHQESISAAVDSMPSTARQAFLALQRRVHWLIFSYVLLRSPITLALVLLPLLILVIFLLLAILMGVQVVDGFRKQLNTLDAAAYARALH